MTYSQIAWLPLAGGLTLLGLIASWFAWRRRGAAAGLRGVAWSLLPLALYLIGAIQLLWRFGTAIGSFAASFVFSPKVWSGMIVAAVALVLFAVSGISRRGRGRQRAGGEPRARALDIPDRRPAGANGGKPGAITPGKPRTAAPLDDDMKDIEAILRRRGIK
jgi:hypothetical protein